jgi:hypothetical protein
MISSAAHFRHAVNEKLSEDQPTDVEDDINAADDCESSSQDQVPQQKLFPCKYPGCAKVYRQISGLRYHEQHVSVSISTAKVLVNIIGRDTRRTFPHS